MYSPHSKIWQSRTRLGHIDARALDWKRSCALCSAWVFVPLLKSQWMLITFDRWSSEKKQHLYVGSFLFVLGEYTYIHPLWRTHYFFFKLFSFIRECKAPWSGTLGSDFYHRKYLLLTITDGFGSPKVPQLMPCTYQFPILGSKCLPG